MVEVLLFRMITSLFPDSSDIGLMDAMLGYSCQASLMVRTSLQQKKDKCKTEKTVDLKKKFLLILQESLQVLQLREQL